MVFVIKTVYNPLSDTARFVKFKDKLSLDNPTLLVLVLISNPLCSHVIVGGGLGGCFRVRLKEMLSVISCVLFRPVSASTIGGTGKEMEQTNKLRSMCDVCTCVAN